MFARFGNHGRKAAWLSFAVLALAPLLATPSQAFNQADLDTLNSTGSCTGAAAANGSYCDLTNADLTDADLTDADLTDAFLYQANLRYANLTSAILTEADLVLATLTDAVLTGADLSYADLTGAWLYYAYLAGADLTDAWLTDAVLSGANLYFATLTGAVLTGAYLAGANLTDAWLNYANLSNANLSNADLTTADLTNATLTDVIYCNTTWTDGTTIKNDDCATVTVAVTGAASSSSSTSLPNVVVAAARNLNGDINALPIGGNCALPCRTHDFTGHLGGFTITTSGGEGSASHPLIGPGSYVVTADIHPTHALQSIVCVDPDDGSSHDLAARTATIDVDPGETIICTFDYAEAVERTSAIINDFMTHRANTLAGAGPTLQHYLDRFNGTAATGLNSEILAFREILNGGGGAAFDAMMVSRESNWAIWAEGTFERYRDGLPGDEVGGMVAMLHGGIDVLIGQSLILGIAVEGDTARELSDDLGYGVEGLGWMAGPYGAIRMGNMILDAKFLWGMSQNDISPFLTYTDRFTTTRWLAGAGLSGEFSIGAALLRPEVDFAYFQETQAEYIDTNGITIPEQTIGMGRLTFGPEIAIPIHTSGGWTIEPRLSLDGVWDIATGDLSARLDGGIQMTSETGLGFAVDGGYAGLFIPDFQSWNVGATLTVPLN